LTLISILLPARDAQATLDEALESIAAQTHRDWELIAVNDGSRDGTAAILERWSRRDARVRVLNPSLAGSGDSGLPGNGIIAALNMALAAARGPVVARMDADDVSLPGRLEGQLALLASGVADVVGCQVRYFPDEVVAGGARRYEAWLNGLLTPEEHARDIFIECPLAHPTLLLPRSLLEAVGGYQARGWPEDYDLLLRLWRRGARLAKVPELLFLWREAPGRTSRTHADYHADSFRRCKAYHLRRSYLANDRPALIWGAGPFGKLLARELLVEAGWPRPGRSGGTALPADEVRRSDPDAAGPLRGFVDLSPRRISQVIYGVKVLSQPEAFRLRGQAFGIAAVGQSGAREEIRAAMAGAGWVETVDFCCAA
jgi:glycosyltransferase involved in cell wall biosynthesis